MKVLVVGSGGREHALVDAVLRSPSAAQVHAAPGNAGIAEVAACHAVAADDVDGLVALARRLAVDLVVVGPEAPLVRGLVDALAEVDIPALGPSRGAAQLEGSKAFTKDLCRRNKIPTAGYKVFGEASEAIAYAETRDRWPAVVKADGLAAGKGVVICTESVEAVRAVRSMMLDRRFGSSGDRIVIEDFLEGEEISIMALVDGETVAVLEPSRDHKAAFDGDTGPNTGGMGAFSPTNLLTPRTYEQIEERVLIPTVHAMARAGHVYRGILYAGLILTEDGPSVLEFNVRGGDPEMEVLLPRIDGDVLALLDATARGRLGELPPIEWTSRACCGVVLADGGYPGEVKPGKRIWGVENAAARPDVRVYHAGTARDEDGHLVTAGGRVLCVVALGDDLAAARDLAYAACADIDFEGVRFRSDIGWRELPSSDPDLPRVKT